MSHLVLYRSFRPKTFDEVIGQDHIVKTLKNQIKNNSFGHAYLFCGTRGTGKTSCAKIFACAVNCTCTENEECKFCKSLKNGENLDIIEIDAASNNRVDEIRDLREKIGYLPSVGKYKVYIVDEVHMLTDSAFNALLKTLEEPPAHAIFILATTEPHKLPATILSRCMRFDFKLVNENDLIAHLKKVFTKSNIKFDEESLKLIAQSGRGSVRDTLSVAEMCSAYCNNDITYKSCLECLGITDSETLIQILSAISDGSAKDIIKITNRLKNEGKNFSVLVNDLIDAINSLITIKLTENANDVLKLPQNIYVSYKDIASKMTSNNMIEYLKVLTELDGKLKLASNIELSVETALLSMIINSNEIIELKRKVDELEKKTLNCDFEKKIENTNNIIKQDITNNIEMEKTEQTKNQGVNQTTEKIVDAKKVFGDILLNVRKCNNPMLYSVLRDVKQVYINNGSFVICGDEITIQEISKDKQVICDFLKPHCLELKLEIFSGQKEQTVEEYLKDKFDDKITIV